MGEVAGKTVAAVKGQVGAAGALVTEQAGTRLTKNWGGGPADSPSPAGPPMAQRVRSVTRAGYCAVVLPPL